METISFAALLISPSDYSNSRFNGFRTRLQGMYGVGRTPQTVTSGKFKQTIKDSVAFSHRFLRVMPEPPFNIYFRHGSSLPILLPPPRWFFGLQQHHDQATEALSLTAWFSRITWQETVQQHFLQ